MGNSSSAPRENILSIVIPARDAERTLRACLLSIERSLAEASLVAQVYVVLDRCQDRTAEIASERSVRVLRCQGKGRSAARNTGIAASDSEYICFIDADCFVPANYFTALMQHIQNRQSDWIQSSIVPVTNKKSHWYFRYYAGTYSRITGDTNNLLEVRFTNQLPLGDSAGLCLRRNALEHVGRFDVRLPRYEDRDLCHRFFLKGCRLDSAPDLSVFKLVEPVNFFKLNRNQIETFVGMLRSLGNIPVFEQTFRASTAHRRLGEVIGGWFRFYFRAIRSRNYGLLCNGFALPLISVVGWIIYWSRHRGDYHHQVETRLRQIGVQFNPGNPSQFGFVVNSRGFHRMNPFAKESFE